MELPHVLHNLKQRFEWQLIHTFVGGMLVICNPSILLYFVNGFYISKIGKYKWGGFKSIDSFGTV